MRIVVVGTGGYFGGLLARAGEEVSFLARGTQLEALNWTMVRLGHEHGLSLPFNFAIYAALKPYANGALR